MCPHERGFLAFAESSHRNCNPLQIGFKPGYYTTLYTGIVMLSHDTFIMVMLYWDAFLMLLTWGVDHGVLFRTHRDRGLYTFAYS